MRPKKARSRISLRNIPLALQSTLLLLACLTGSATQAGTPTTLSPRTPLVILAPSGFANDLGQSSYAEEVEAFRKKDKLDKDPVMLARLVGIADNLVEVAQTLFPETAKWQWELHLAETDTINATCRPGGKIMVYSALADRLKNEGDALPAVLAHEVAHALLQHGRQSIASGLVVNTALQLLGHSFRMDGLGASMLSETTNLSVSYPKTRKHETEADILGIELMARAGYSPAGAYSIWSGHLLGASDGAAFYNDHPTDAQRAAAIEKKWSAAQKLRRSWLMQEFGVDEKTATAHLNSPARDLTVCMGEAAWVDPKNRVRTAVALQKKFSENELSELAAYAGNKERCAVLDWTSRIEGRAELNKLTQISLNRSVQDFLAHPLGTKWRVEATQLRRAIAASLAK